MREFHTNNQELLALIEMIIDYLSHVKLHLGEIEELLKG